MQLFKTEKWKYSSNKLRILWLLKIGEGAEGLTNAFGDIVQLSLATACISANC